MRILLSKIENIGVDQMCSTCLHVLPKSTTHLTKLSFNQRYILKKKNRDLLLPVQGCTSFFFFLTKGCVVVLCM